MMTELITTSVVGELSSPVPVMPSASTGVAWMVSTMDRPTVTDPKMVWMPLRKVGVFSVMKNCDPFEFGPELAIANK